MQKILIVVDMQNDFISGSLGSKEAQEIVPNVVAEIKKAKNENTIIIATQDTHFESGVFAYKDTLEGQKLPVLHCVCKTPGWEIEPSVEDAMGTNAVVIEKGTFGSLNLLSYLKELNYEETVSEFEIIGLCTDICVVSNALLIRARFPNTPITVKEDCCAGVTPAKHKAAIETMKSCQIDVI